MIRPTIVLLTLLALSPIIFAQTSLEERLRETKLQDAALRAVEESVGTLEEQLSGAEDLAAAMLGEPAVHIDKDPSRDKLRADERRRLQQAFRAQLVLFASHLPGLAADWVDRALADNTIRVEQTIKPLLDTGFAPRYEQAREIAVKRQAAQLDLAQLLTPTPAEIESLLDTGRLPGAAALDIASVVAGPEGRALVAAYIERVSAARVLFEENRRVLGERVAAMAAGGLGELDAQFNRLHAYRVEENGAIITAGALEADILAGLEPAEGWGIFPAVGERASELAEVLELELFRIYAEWQLSPEAGCPALPPERVHSFIPDSVGEIPAAWTSHLRQLGEALDGATRKYLVEDYSTHQSDPAPAQPFRQRLYDYLARPGRQGVADDFQEGLARCLEVPLRAQRDRLAAQELALRRPALAAGTLELDDNELEQLQSRPKRPLTVLALPSLPDAGGLQLDETHELFEARRRALLAEGAFTAASQVSIVARHQAEFEQRIKQDPERKQRREHWQQAYEEQVLADWRLVRDEAFRRSMNMLAEGKYDRVIASAKKLIADLLPTDWEPEPEPEQPEQTQAQTAAAAAAPPAGSDCESVAAACEQASRVCYQALSECSAGGDCADPLARCRTAKTQCETQRRAAGG